MRRMVYILAVGLAVSLLVTACGDNSGVDKPDGDTTDGDSTSGEPWYDSTSGLTWQNPPASEQMEWQGAIDYCDKLSLDGHNDWRLPTISEMRSLIRGCPDTETGGACGWTDSCLNPSCRDDSCYGCTGHGGPDGGCYRPEEMEGSCSWFWSSSLFEDDLNPVFGVEFYGGGVSVNFAGYLVVSTRKIAPPNPLNYVRCMRGDALVDGDEGDMEIAGASWMDPDSGLTWQNPPANNIMRWQDAIGYCNNLDLDGYSGWHLPTISELRSLIRGCHGTVTGGDCAVGDSCLTDSCFESDACWNCQYNAGPAHGCYWPDDMKGSCDEFWSSSPMEDGASTASCIKTQTALFGAVAAEASALIRVH